MRRAVVSIARRQETRKGFAAAALLWPLLFVTPAVHAEQPAALPAQLAPQLAPALDPVEMRRQLASGVRHGLLFEATRGQQKLILFGTAHLGRPDVFPLDGPAFAALQASDAVAVELDIRKAEAMSAVILEHARLPAGQTLETISTPEQWATIKAALLKHNAMSDVITHAEPWIASSTLIMTEAGRRGQTMQTGADLMTIAFAQAFKKPVVELESAELQSDALGSAPLPKQVESLMYTIGQIESGKGDDDMLGIIDAWVSADFDRLSRYRRSMKEEGKDGGPEVYAALLLDREAAMVQRIETYRAQYGQLFIAIGALHLAGDDSLVARLQREGYVVKRL